VPGGHQRTLGTESDVCASRSTRRNDQGERHRGPRGGYCGGGRTIRLGPREFGPPQWINFNLLFRGDAALQVSIPSEAQLFSVFWYGPASLDATLNVRLSPRTVSAAPECRRTLLGAAGEPRSFRERVCAPLSPTGSSVGAPSYLRNGPRSRWKVHKSRSRQRGASPMSNDSVLKSNAESVTPFRQGSGVSESKARGGRRAWTIKEFRRTR